MRKIAVCILTAILITTSVVCYSENLSEELSGGIVRLHVIAESNSEADQRIKLKVRDALLEKMEELDNINDIEENLFTFESVANEILEKEGFLYTARAEYGRFDFPTKHYENFSLPKGEYNAVRIKLGKAEGENWWCVLFPPLCMVDAATEEADALLKETFGENYPLVTEHEKIPVKIKFKIAELF
ncbi:MAG: stage II sporulation protein R [Clostridia bacterium]|nr:stage II sporulation protein R [Clostridia bacterium]